ncbi:MAG: N-acetylmuramic acid 6-phosphate etherase [Rhizobiaceae bacterium]
MALRRTEEVHGKARGLDTQPPLAVLKTLVEAQVEAASAVKEALPALAAASELAARQLSAGGRLVYAAAGSSGLMALADALELPGTFGIARERIVMLFAGGAASLQDLAGGPEDDEQLAAADVASAHVGAADCVIAVSASGSTPYALAALRAARASGGRTIGIANNADAPLFALSDVPVHLPTPPEVIAGSTRMGAGTAQKIALNLFSTLLAIRLGHVHDGYMVGVRPDNAKLKARAARIVAAIGGCAEGEAQILLEKAGGSVKAAVLMAAGAADAVTAGRILERAGSRLRPALSMIEGSHGSGETGAEKRR